MRAAAFTLSAVSTYVLMALSFFFIYSAFTTSPAFPFGRLIADIGSNPTNYVIFVAAAVIYFGIQAPVILIAIAADHLIAFPKRHIWIRAAYWLLALVCHALLIVALPGPSASNNGTLGSIDANHALVAIGIWCGLGLFRRLFVLFNDGLRKVFLP